MRSLRSQAYRLKAYYIQNDTQSVFFCKEKKIKNITNEMGASMPMSNGERMLETESRLDFQINQKVKIGNDSLTIQQVNSDIDNKDLNSMRGAPEYITTLLVK